ncbi:MAG: hypothetical protein V4578_16795 [Pseudomonadota bacterium]
MKKILVTMLTLAIISGCAGTRFSWDQARMVKVGMTEAELTSLMGRPYMVSTKGDVQLWIWSEASAFGGSRSVSFPMKAGKVSSLPTIPASFDK